MTRLVFILVMLFSADWQEAEIVDVRNRGPVDLKAFNCQDVTRSSVVSRVCYDEAKRRMVVQRHAVHDLYCGLPKVTLDAFLNAASMGQYFRANIEGRGGDGPYGCRMQERRERPGAAS